MGVTMLQSPMSTPKRNTPPVGIAFASKEETAALRLVVRSVIASVLGLGKDHPDVEDGTHETFSRAIEGGARLREGEPLRPWVIGIARHVALDALRLRKRTVRERLDMSDDESDVTSSVLERVVDPSPGPEERAASAQRAQKLHEVLQQLGEDQREVLLMFHVEGLGYQEIAAKKGVPLGTIATWISRGRRAIADALPQDAEGKRSSSNDGDRT